jgi:hypothetical protein
MTFEANSCRKGRRIRKLHPRMEVDDVISYHDVVMSEIWEAQAASLLVFGCQPKLTLLHAS